MEMSLPVVSLAADPTPSISLVPTNYPNMISNPWNITMPNDLIPSQNYWPSFG